MRKSTTNVPLHHSSLCVFLLFFRPPDLLYWSSFFLPDRLNRVHHPVRESVNPTRDVPHNLFKFFSPANSFLLRGFHVFETIKRSQHQDLYKSFNSSSSVCFFASRPSVIQGWEAFSALIIASQSKKRRKLYLTNNPQSSGLVYFITWERLNETSARWA